MRKWSVLLLAIVCACGPSSRQSPGGDDDSGGDAGNGGGDGNGGQQGTGSDGCSAAAKLIYVIDQHNILAQFDPMAKTFTQKGTISCPVGTSKLNPPNKAQPFSMAVDRNAQAYVLFDDDKIYKVDTTQATLPCTATSWVSSTNPVLQEFGMGYSTDMAGGSADTLYIAGGKDLSGTSSPSSSTLATLDMSALAATKVGTVTGWPELTGNSNAELWGFFPDVDGSTQPLVAQIDKTTGAFTTKYAQAMGGPLDSGTPGAWAFGFYGGDYWVFLAYSDGNPISPTTQPTTVYQIAGPGSMSGTPGSVVSMTSAGSLVIVGAGVSTCAPTMIF